MSESALIFTNVTNIVLIVLFAYYRYRVKRLEMISRGMEETIPELCRATINHICGMARSDYLHNLIPKEVFIGVILKNIPMNEMRYHHLAIAGIKYIDIKDIDNEELKNYFRMGEEKEQQTKNG
ncbi:MAG: hypothetical protein CVT92_02595 [Bacteroidetes bacterium HGW-Bacteroidetes-1]|nr:MAG: hypothetical protein CVT92_02595 [Bacteroidetes bacterium HGW-Bacteroidetes-1]